MRLLLLLMIQEGTGKVRNYSMDLRERVVAACDRGEGTREQIAKRFCVSVAWVYRLLARRRDTGSIAPKPHGGGQPPAFQGESAERLRKAVEDRPDATLEDLRAATGVDCGTSAVFLALNRLGLPRKKSPSGLLSRAAPS
jgi:transposase